MVDQLEPPAEAAIAAYVNALYSGASELVALYAAVTAWLRYHPGMVVDEAREAIKALVGAPRPENVIEFP